MLMLPYHTEQSGKMENLSDHSKIFSFGFLIVVQVFIQFESIPFSLQNHFGSRPFLVHKKAIIFI